MNKETPYTSLLPSGFEDLLPPDASQEYAAIGALIDTFMKFGYERVKPPLAEFEESLLSKGPGATLADETFRVMDPVSHKMMGLRSDITAQIARIALSRLSDDARPLRLTYANDVIRTKSSQARTGRQFTQVGCELIGHDDPHADIEICVVALKGLSALGIENVSIDFALPGHTDKIFKLTQTDENEIDQLRHTLAGPADKAIKALEDIGLKDIDHLKTVVSGVQAAIAELGLEGFSITVDPLETRGFEYHKGLAFTLFSSSIRGELGRGGRYDIYEGDQPKESAAGFTLYMDTLRQGLKAGEEKPVKKVSKDTSWGDIQKLQDDGHIVKREY